MQKQKKGILPLLLLQFPSFYDLFDNQGDLVPIINTSVERLREEFIVRSLEPEAYPEFHHPQALVIVETEESTQ